MNDRDPKSIPEHITTILDIFKGEQSTLLTTTLSHLYGEVGSDTGITERKMPVMFEHIVSQVSISRDDLIVLLEWIGITEVGYSGDAGWQVNPLPATGEGAPKNMIAFRRIQACSAYFRG